MTVPFPRDRDPNTDLLVAVANHIEEHPDQYNQSWFAEQTACGTTCCVAGTALALSGYKPDLYVRGLQWIDMRTGARVSVIATAQCLLGIGASTADVLFDAFWKPVEGMTVPDALRALADGAHVASITDRVALVGQGVTHDDDDTWHVEPITFERHVVGAA